MLSEQQQRDGRPGEEEELRRHEDGQRHQQQLSQSGDLELKFIRVFFVSDRSSSSNSHNFRPSVRRKFV